ncbi:diguanylate cyclase [Tepidibacillus fermentans]|uniref:PAS domain S-box-containing protein/diguanylate cyclase (GGDEF)-like protein n=1 Tax=Tepidibacillus fermentans TaxID=1281767 RepID=A0A4R3KH58_9BACI|nr:diguanylate cyclase [Tepidibacillus fermentans]TCS82525.1 PAS domain S-box-containing protein/diguanylate cyclase (GGDEF)-like protein [Tepidibacillus fermentans]
MRKNIREKKKKILLVEDSRLTALVVAEYLNKNGYETEIVTTGEEAVQKISGGFPPDLVLMDIELAGEMDGIEAARKIIKLRNIPVVFLTANTSEEIIEKIKEVRAYGFVLKNTDKAVLLSTVEMAIKLHEANTHARMFEWLFENSLNELYVFHPKSLKFVTVNRAARRNLGYTIEELKTMTPLDLKPELDLQSFRELLNPLVSGEQEQIQFNTVHRRKDGSLYPVEINLQLFDYEGEKLCMALVVDLTERKQLEEEKRRKEDQQRLMLEAIPSPAWLVSRERRILAQNKAAVSLFETKVGDYCWKRVLSGGNLPDKYREAIEKSGSPLPGTKCYFCRADEAFDRNEPLNSEVELSGTIWDTWWIPLGEDIFLHYANDVTKYKKMEEELRSLSVTDVLTNAYNRRYFIQKLEEEIERARRNGNKFSLVMLDIDRFKSINDRFGHNAGDLVLKRIAEMIKNRIRKIDILVRWGGEEFIILLPDTTVKNAARLAEELRVNLSRMDIPGVGRVTASFGVVSYCLGDTVDSLVNKVDNMMYEAKAAGRNSVRELIECE